MGFLSCFPATENSVFTFARRPTSETLGLKRTQSALAGPQPPIFTLYTSSALVNFAFYTIRALVNFTLYSSQLHISGALVNFHLEAASGRR